MLLLCTRADLDHRQAFQAAVAGWQVQGADQHAAEAQAGPKSCFAVRGRPLFEPDSDGIVAGILGHICCAQRGSMLLRLLKVSPL